MQKHVRWLHEELQFWVRDGVVSEAQAQQIQNRYPNPKTLPWATIVFSGLGSFILGLGVILLFAHNWHLIPRFGKLALIFGLLLGTYYGGLRLFWNHPGYRGLGESLTILGTMFFGAGIWLVAQIYHLDAHYPNAFLVWGVGAFLMAWSLPSVGQGLMAVVLLTIWSLSEAWKFHYPAHFVLLMMVALGILAWKERSALLLTLSTLSFILNFSFLIGILHSYELIWIGSCLSLATFFVALSRILQNSVFPPAARVFSFFGWSLGCGVMYYLTFSVRHNYLFWNRERPEIMPVIYLIILVLLATIAWIHWVRLIRQNKSPFILADVLLPLTALLILTWIYLPQTPVNPYGDYREMSFKDSYAVMSFNLVFLALAISIMARGCREVQLKPTIFGALLLIALALARYTDLFQSLVTRGEVFIVVGLVLFLEGFFFTRARKQLQRVSA